MLVTYVLLLTLGLIYFAIPDSAISLSLATVRSVLEYAKMILF